MTCLVAAGMKQQIQDKLHLLKLSSIDVMLAGGGLCAEEPVSLIIF
jgi:hypothetical protein